MSSNRIAFNLYGEAVKRSQKLARSSQSGYAIMIPEDYYKLSPSTRQKFKCFHDGSDNDFSSF